MADRRSCCSETAWSAPAGDDDWDRLHNGIDIRYSDGENLREECREARERATKLPFPLLYKLLATLPNPPARLCGAEITLEEQLLAKLINEQLTSKIELGGKHDLFKELPAIGTDHIFSTNYPAILEKVFLPRSSFANPATRSYYRFHLNREKMRTTCRKESRLHTGYRIETRERPVGIWHIYGECSVPHGVVLGHDRYGRLLESDRAMLRRVGFRAPYPRPTCDIVRISLEKLLCALGYGQGVSKDLENSHVLFSLDSNTAS